MAKVCPVPKNNLECYAGILLSLSTVYGIRDIPELYNYVELLMRAIQKYRANEENNLQDVGNDESAERKKFIILFLNKFRQARGFDYPSSVTPADGNMIGDILNKLKGLGVKVEDYINWVFDTFEKENDKIKILQMKTVFSNFIFNNFVLYAHDSGLAEQRRLEEQKTIELNNIANRIRSIKREYGEGRPELVEKLKSAIEMLKSNRITIDSLNESLTRLELRLRENVKNEDKENVGKEEN